MRAFAGDSTITNLLLDVTAFVAVRVVDFFRLDAGFFVDLDVDFVAGMNNLPAAGMAATSSSVDYLIRETACGVSVLRLGTIAT